MCAKQGDSAPGTTGTFNAAEAPFGNAKLAGNTALFHSNIMGDPNNPQGIFSCKNAITSPKLAAVVLPTSKKPTGTYGSGLEEDSIRSSLRCSTMKTGCRWESSSSSCRKREPRKDTSWRASSRPPAIALRGRHHRARPLSLIVNTRVQGYPC